jgi:hypothetical protein
MEAFNVMPDHKNYPAVDRISELPDHLLQEILSFLLTKQAVQSTILSKRWKHVGTTSPVLDFDTTSFGSISWRVAAMGKKKNIQKKNEEHRGYTDFYNFAEKTLRSHSKKRLQVKKLTLIDCLDKQKSVSRVDRWINFLVESNIVEELSLDFQHGWYYRSYHLTRSVLVSKSLTGLSVCKCKLVSTSYGDINLPSSKNYIYVMYLQMIKLLMN